MANEPEQNEEPTEIDEDEDEGVQPQGATGHAIPQGATGHATPDGATGHAVPGGATGHATPAKEE